MKNKIYWIIGIIVAIVYFLGPQIELMGIYGWEETTEGGYSDLAKSTVISTGYCAYSDWDTTCSGCYWKYGEPYACNEIDEDYCQAELKIIEFENQNYTNCHIFTTSDTRGRTCHKAYCTECPNELVKQLYDNKPGTCLDPQCYEGETQTLVCGDGSTITTHICEGRLWSTTETQICCINGETQTKTCEDGEKVMTYQCIDNDWVRVVYCPEDLPPTEPVEPTVVYVEAPPTTYYEPTRVSPITATTITTEDEEGLSKNMVALIVAGLGGLYILTSKPKKK